MTVKVKTDPNWVVHIYQYGDAGELVAAIDIILLAPNFEEALKQGIEASLKYGFVKDKLTAHVTASIEL